MEYACMLLQNKNNNKKKKKQWYAKDDLGQVPIF